MECFALEGYHPYIVVALLESSKRRFLAESVPTNLYDGRVQSHRRPRADISSAMTLSVLSIFMGAWILPSSERGAPAESLLFLEPYG
jgi:hypothetical protein